MPLRVFSLLRSTAGAFAVTGDNVLLCYVCFTISEGRKNFDPRPQNRILVPQRFFRTFGTSIPGVPSGGGSPLLY